MARLAGLMAAMVVGWVLALGPPAMAQQGDDAEALSAQVRRLYGEGKYAEAIPLAQRVLALRETALGPDHPDVGLSLNNLAYLYGAQGRYGDAEPLYKRSLGIAEKALGPDHPNVGQSLNNLAGLYQAQGRYADAGRWLFLKRSWAPITRNLPLALHSTISICSPMNQGGFTNTVY